MYLTRSSLSCQTMFRFMSDWLYSFSVVLRCDTNTKIFVLLKLFPTKPERIVFFFDNQELLQHRSKTSISSHFIGGVQAFAENMSIDSLPEACASLMTFDIIFLSMSPRRSTLPICSGASSPASLIITSFFARIELNKPLLCVPQSQRKSLGQPAQRVQPCTKACRHA